MKGCPLDIFHAATCKNRVLRLDYLVQILHQARKAIIMLVAHITVQMRITPLPSARKLVKLAQTTAATAKSSVSQGIAVKQSMTQKPNKLKLAKVQSLRLAHPRHYYALRDKRANK